MENGFLKFLLIYPAPLPNYQLMSVANATDNWVNKIYMIILLIKKTLSRIAGIGLFLKSENKTYFIKLIFLVITFLSVKIFTMYVPSDNSDISIVLKGAALLMLATTSPRIL